MHRTRIPGCSTQRNQHVFVDIPPHPLHRHQPSAFASAIQTGCRPLDGVIMVDTNDSSAPHKRKRAFQDVNGRASEDEGDYHPATGSESDSDGLWDRHSDYSPMERSRPATKKLKAAHPRQKQDRNTSKNSKENLALKASGNKRKRRSAGTAGALFSSSKAKKATAETAWIVRKN